jgi:hypothetical protein
MLAGERRNVRYRNRFQDAEFRLLLCKWSTTIHFAAKVC